MPRHAIHRTWIAWRAGDSGRNSFDSTTYIIRKRTVNIWTLFDAFRRDVSALSDGIQQLTEVHEEMAACASDPELVCHLRRHLKQTEQQVMNLDRIAEMLSEQDLPVTNHAARGMAREVRDAVDAAQTNHVRDWIITTAADTIARTEIARYTGLPAMARQLAP